MRKRRTLYAMFRIHPREKRELIRRAAHAELSREQYIRCKIFDIPFESSGGRPERGEPGRA